MKLKATYDPQADAAYVSFSRTPVSHQVILDDARVLDLAADGTVIGVEILGPSGGVDFTGLPNAAEVSRALRRFGFPAVSTTGPSTD